MKDYLNETEIMVMNGLM